MVRRTILITITTAALLGAAAVGIAVYGQGAAGRGHAEESDRPSSVVHHPSFTQPAKPIATDFFIDTNDVDRFWSKSESETQPIVTGIPVAGVVNHHTLAADLIADFFVRLQTSRPDIKRFVIISPDHFNAGQGYISTHTRPYEVGTSTVSMDKDGVRTLLDSGLVTKENGLLFEQEHGVGALIPFLTKAYPDALIIPVAYRGDLPKDVLPSFSEALRDLWDEETVIILSADMSHYLTTEQALERDEDTEVWLRTKDETIASATDDNIDSGKSTAAVFMAMHDLHPQATFNMFDHAISSDYGGEDTYTTSYITGVWIEN